MSKYVELPCGRDLVRAGIAFACHSHVRSIITRPRVAISGLRQQCAHSIASIALRRWLGEMNVPHELSPAAPLTDPHHMLVTVGGRRWQLLNRLVRLHPGQRRSATEPDQVPDSWLAAMRPDVMHTILSPGDLILVSILIAQVCHGLGQTERMMKTAPLAAMIAIPPRSAWRSRRAAPSMERLKLRHTGDESLDLELCGADIDHRPSILTVRLPSGKPKEIITPWHYLLYAHTEKLPGATCVIECPTRAAQWSVPPGSWSNLWFYEPHLYLAGWMTEREWQRIPSRLDGAERAPPSSCAPELRPSKTYQALRAPSQLVRIIRHM
jgi:hypothetical protein